MASTKPSAKLEEDSDDFDSDEFSFSDLYTSAGQHVAEQQKKLKEELLKKLREPSCYEHKPDLETSPPPIKITKSSEIENCESSSNSTEPEIITPIPRVPEPEQVGRVTRSRVARTVRGRRGRSRRGTRGSAARRGRNAANADSDQDYMSSENDEPSPVVGKKAKPASSRAAGTRKSAEIRLLPRPNILANQAIEVSDDSEQDISFLVEEDPNWEVSVKVCWRFKDIHKFKIRKFQKFTSIFEFLSKMENVPQDQVQLILNDYIIQPSDTPDSLQLSIANIIEGGVIKLRPAESVSNVRSQSPVDKDSIQLKVCTKDSKEPIVIKLRKTEKMMVLMIKVSEEIEKSLDKLKFSFDGETLNPNETPEDLDLEGGEMIDLRILSS